MWLINVKTRLLEEYSGNNVPPYAILSHTWEIEEVTYKQYLSGNYHWLKGYQKINMTCRIAAKAGIGHAWVDTCCIDKSSSAELSEAINSMFRWYKRAKVCYVYLTDLAANADLDVTLSKCRWFTRGWTLQELIAPNEVRFFDASWNTTESRTKKHLALQLSEITNINVQVLSGDRPLKSICVAQKMSWASRRSTTRIEDQAYSLLGIFDLNMPVLYGEEEKAFMRLQDEIIRSTADLSILAWSLPESQQGWPSNDECRDSSQQTTINPRESYLCGLLARAPADFQKCGDYERYFEGGLREFSSSNLGIRTRVRFVEMREANNSYALCFPVQCTSNGARLCIRLRAVSRADFLRRDPWNLYDYDRNNVRQPLHERYLLTNFPSDWEWPVNGLASLETTMRRLRSYVVRMQPPGLGPKPNLLSSATELSFQTSNPWPTDLYDQEDAMFFVSRDTRRDYGTIDIRLGIPEYGDVDATVVMLGWSEKSDVVQPYFGIIHRNPYIEVLGKIRSQQSDLHITSRDVLDRLRENGIPQTHRISQELCFPDLVAEVSIQQVPLESNNVSGELCLDLKVSIRIISRDQADWFVDRGWRPPRKDRP